jgi:hypothetical protein
MRHHHNLFGGVIVFICLTVFASSSLTPSSWVKILQAKGREALLSWQTSYDIHTLSYLPSPRFADLLASLASLLDVINGHFDGGTHKGHCSWSGARRRRKKRKRKVGK